MLKTFQNFDSFQHLTDYKFIRLFFHDQQLSMKFIMLINVKITIIVGILTFISKINTRYESLKAKNVHVSAELS